MSHSCVIKSLHNRLYRKHRRGDKRGAGGAGGAIGEAGAAKARAGAVTGAKEVGDYFPPLFQLVKWVSWSKRSVNGDLLDETN